VGLSNVARKQRRKGIARLIGGILYRRNRPSASGLDPEAVHKKSQGTANWAFFGSDDGERFGRR